jgi:hypothetical protein
MEATQKIKDEHNDYASYLIIEQRKKALETYKAIRKKMVEKKNNGKRVQLLLQIEGD